MIELKIAGIVLFACVIVGVYCWALRRANRGQQQMTSDNLRKGVENLMAKLERDAVEMPAPGEPLTEGVSKDGRNERPRTPRPAPPKAQTSKAGPRRASAKRGKK